MKKIIIGVIIIIAIVLIIFGINKLTSNNGVSISEKGEDTVNSVLGKKLDSKDLSIDDYSWEVNPKVDKYSNRGYALSFTNNSKYDVIGVEIDYKTKDDVTDDELKIFDEFRNSHEGYIDEDDSSRDISLISKKDTLVKKGENIDNSFLFLGHKKTYWDNFDGYPTKEQFELMEPSTLELGIIGEDLRLYIAYYDFVNQKWSIYDDSKKLNTWPSNEMSKKIKEPDCDYYILKSDTDDEDVDLICYGVSEEKDKEYIKTMQDSGFTVDAPEYYEYSYSAKNADGNEIEVRYDKEKNRMLVFANID